MAVTRSQRPNPGSPKSESPTTAAQAKSAPAAGKKNKRSKAKVQNTSTAATGPKSAKVRKSKSSNRKGSKPASKESSKTPALATSKSSSRTSPNATIESAFQKFSNSKSLFTVNAFTPELMEELGLAYVDLTFLNSPGLILPPAQSEQPSAQPGVHKPELFANDFKNLSSEHLENPDACYRGSLFGTHATTSAAPTEVPHGGRLFGNNNPPTFPNVPRQGRADYIPGLDDIAGAFGSPLNPDAIATSPVKGVFVSLDPEKLSPVSAVLGAFRSPLSPPLVFLQSWGNAEDKTQRRGDPVDPTNKGDGTASRPKRSPSTVVRDIVRQVKEQPVSAPPARMFGVRPSEEVPGNNVDEPEEQRPESPVSVNNAQVFKRPTVADLRRERAQLHDELDGWVKSLKYARDEFDGVIGEIEARMRVLKAVNKMQAPLRKAPLRRRR